MTNLMNRNAETNRKMHEMTVPFRGLSLSEATASQIHDAFVAAGITDRATYLAWVAQYCALINEASDIQRALRAQAKQEDYSAQCSRQMNRSIISRLIDLRRMSRVAARVSRDAERRDTAA